MLLELIAAPVGLAVMHRTERADRDDGAQTGQGPAALLVLEAGEALAPQRGPDEAIGCLDNHSSRDWGARVPGQDVAGPPPQGHRAEVAAQEREEAIRAALPDAAKVTGVLIAVLGIGGLKSDQVAQVVRSYVGLSFTGLTILALTFLAVLVVLPWRKYHRLYGRRPDSTEGHLWKAPSLWISAVCVACLFAIVGSIYGAVTANGQVSTPSIGVTTTDGVARIEVSAVNLKGTSAALISAYASCPEALSSAPTATDGPLFEEMTGEPLVRTQAGPDDTGRVQFVTTVPLEAAGEQEVFVRVAVPANSSRWTRGELAETCVRVVPE